MPNFFAVGSVKAASTALNYYLRCHPQVYMSPLKEPHYFAKDIDPGQFSHEHRNAITTDYKTYIKSDMTSDAHFAYVQNWNEYLELFRYVNAEIVIGESSNSYLYSKVAAHEIRKAVPEAKIAMVLRNPADRAFSHWLMDRSIGYSRRGFLSEVEADLKDKMAIWGRSRLYVRLGMYAAQVERFLRAFPARQIKILLMEDLKCRRQETIRDLYGFLNIDTNFAPPMRTINEAQVPRARWLNQFMHQSGLKLLISRYVPEHMKHAAQRYYYRADRLPKMSVDERRRLVDIFHADIIRLQSLIGRDLSAWLEVAS